MRVIFAVAQLTLCSLSESNVILVNDTGLPIARIEIDNRHFEDVGSGTARTGEVFVNVTPEKHYLRLVFKGGAKVVWPDFNFKGLHEIIFERVKNKIEIRAE